MPINHTIKAYVNVILYKNGVTLPDDLADCRAERIPYDNVLDSTILKRCQEEKKYVLVITDDDTDSAIITALNLNRSDHLIGSIFRGVPQYDALLRELTALGSRNSLTDEKGNSYVITDWNAFPGIAQTAGGQLVLTGFEPAGTEWQTGGKILYDAAANQKAGFLLAENRYSRSELLQKSACSELTLQEKLRFIREVMLLRAASEEAPYPFLGGTLYFFRSGAFLAKKGCHAEVYATENAFLHNALLGEPYRSPEESTGLLLHFLDKEYISTALISDLETAFIFGAQKSPAFWAAEAERELNA